MVTVCEKHEIKVCTDTVKNPAKALLGGPTAEEAEKTLREKYRFSDAMIRRLKSGK